MQINHLSENLIELTMLPKIFPVSVYLVREEDGFTLIDAGMAGMKQDILATAAKEGLPIVRIALTHTHADHVGALDGLAADLPAAEVLVGAREARFLDRDFSLDANEAQSKLRGGWPEIKTRPSRLLNDGDMIGSLQVVTSPGHTPGHIAFFDTRDASLIAGDSFMIQGGLAVSGILRWRFPLGPFVTWDVPTALQSARKLRALNPKRLVAGHGPAIEQPTAAMDRAIQEAEQFVGKSSKYATTSNNS
jgi:glyoxylase-like metal-dependent hydrolase (beta-lactamase superfamily II)